MPFAHVNDIHIYYERTGAGEPLLLIQGMGANVLNWGKRLPELLAQRYALIVFDNRGAGRSDQPQGPYGMDQMAADAVGLLDHLSIPQTHVFGVSMGGIIAQHMALNHGDRIDKLILGCAAPGYADHIPTDENIRLALQTPPAGEPVAAALNQLWMSYPDDFVAQNQEYLEAHIRRVVQFPSQPRAREAQMAAIYTTHHLTADDLAQIPHETLVLTGGRDRLVMPGNSIFLSQVIPHAQLAIIQGAGHAFGVSHPEETARRVTDFLG